MRVLLRDFVKAQFGAETVGRAELATKFEGDGGLEFLGLASRTNYDLNAHMTGSGTKLHYFDAEAIDPETGKQGYRYIPHVVEPAAGATRGVLAVLCNAYTEEVDDKGETRVVLKLHPRLAPYKVAILPLVKKDDQLVARGREIAARFFQAGIAARYEDQNTIGKRYARHDEIGTPYCLTIDSQTLEDGTVTIRYRDDRRQERIRVEDAVDVVVAALRTGKL